MWHQTLFLEYSRAVLRSTNLSILLIHSCEVRVTWAEPRYQTCTIVPLYHCTLYHFCFPDLQPLMIFCHQQTIMRNTYWFRKKAWVCKGQNVRVLRGPARGPFAPKQPEPEIYPKICYTYMTETRLSFIQARIKSELFKIRPGYSVINTCFS